MTKRRRTVIIIVAVLAGLWLINGLLSSRKPSGKLAEVELKLIERGNLDVPISAAGSVEPAARAEIKCKASGTVKKIYFDTDKVKKGSLLVELDPVDEERTVRNATAEVVRAQASLALAQSDAEKAERDWPMQVESALAGLEAARAALQGSVITFRRQSRLVQGQDAQWATMDIINTDNITPAPVIPSGVKENASLKLVSRIIAIAEEEVKAAGRQVEQGRAVVAEKGQNRPEKSFSSLMEYQDALIAMWQSESKVLDAVAQVRNAVNMGILVNEAKTKVTLAQEGLQQAQVSLDQADQRLRDTKITAPFDGVIQEVFVKEGQIISSGITTVTGGTPVLVLADVSRLYVDSDVDEADIGRVRDLAPVERSARLSLASIPAPDPTGAPPTTRQVKLTAENEEEMKMLRASNNVSITVDAFREDSFTGKVDRVYPNPKNVNNIVTYNVRIVLTSPNRTELMLGMHANVKFTSRKLVNVLKVPTEAIRIKNEDRGVYTPGRNNKPEFIPVKVGLTDGTMIEIRTDKLKEGQRVFTKLPKMDDEKKSDGD
jgi:RND family efflux transporter MFP subunit